MTRTVPIIMCIGLVAALHASGQNKAPRASLVGIWASERTFNRGAESTLLIDGRQSPWLAHLGGFTVQIERHSSSISFLLPYDHGRFEGTVSPDGRSISGHWVQPATVVDGYPFSTPVELNALDGQQAWTGRVVPLPDRLTLYLVIRRSTDGDLTAFIRSPESNFGAHRVFRAEISGATIRLVNIQNEKDEIHGSYDDRTDRLSLTIPKSMNGVTKILVAFDFTRRTPDDAIGFYPRTPAVTHFDYRPPVLQPDGWVTASLQDVGMAEAPIATAINTLLNETTEDSSAPYIQGILVARHGKLVLEEYFYGFDANRPHDLRSAGKSFTSALVGIAMSRGARFRLDTPVYSLFPEYKEYLNPDPRKQKVLVRNLLTMTSGLACNDADEASPGNELTMFAQTGRPDFYKFVLDLPMAQEPGLQPMIYCTGGINLLGGIIRNATGMRLIDFFETHLGRPLQMSSYHLNLTPTGDMYGGGGLYMRPRDALKLGQLYLDGGVWNGRRILSRSWVDQSVQRHSGYSLEHGYGLAWHLFQLKVDGTTFDEFEAQGNGGQVINVIPLLNLAVIFTTGNYGDDETVPEREVLSAIIKSVAQSGKSTIR